jgi:hypothetical protein
LGGENVARNKAGNEKKIREKIFKFDFAEKLHYNNVKE